MLTLPRCNDMEGKREGEVWNYTVNERPLEVEDFCIEPIEAETAYLNAYFMPNRTRCRPKQLHKDPFEEVVSVQSQTNSGIIPFSGLSSCVYFLAPVPDTSNQ